MTQETADVLKLRVTADEQAAERSVQTMMRVEAPVKSLAAEFAKITPEASAAAAGVQSAFGRAIPVTAQVETGIESLRAEYDRLTEAERRAGNEAERTGQRQKNAAQGGSALNSARQVAGQAGGVLSVVGGGQVGSAVGSVLALTQTLGPLGVASGGLALIMQKQAQAADAARESEARRLNAQAEIAEFIATSTAEEKRLRLDGLQEQRTILLGQQAQQRADLQDAQQQLTPIAGVLNSIVSPDIVGKAEAAEAALKDTGAALATNAEQQSALEIALNRGTTTAADLAAGEERLADIREKVASVQTSRQMAQAQNEIDAQRMTTAEREKAIAALSEEIAGLEHFRDRERSAGRLTEEAARGLAQRLDTARDRMAALTAVTYSFADAAAAYEARQQALSQQTDNYFAALEKEGEIRGKIAEISQQIVDITNEANQKYAELIAEKEEKRGELEAEAGDRRAEIAQESAERIAKIERDAGRERLNAIGERDALAFDQAKQRQETALEDQQTAEDKQLASLDKTLKKQEASLEQSYRKQEQQIAASAAQQIAIKRAALQQEQVNLQNVLYAEQQIALTGAGNLRIIHTQMWQDVNNIAVTWAANTVNTLRSIFGVLTGGAITSSPGSYSPLPPVSGTAAVKQIARQEARDYIDGLYSRAGAFTPTAY